MKLAAKIIILSALLALSNTSFADELLVPSQYPAIQSAINAAVNGDTIIVAPGTYTGPGNRDIDFLGKAITVRSQSGPNNCIIDCNGTEEDLHRGFYFHSGEEQNSVLDGFTITNGCAHKGGAIKCDYYSSPTITNCIIRGNISPYVYVPDPFVPMIILQDGGGIYCYNSSPIIKKCCFIENTATAGGGAIFSGDGNAQVDNCIFRNNRAAISGGAIELSGVYGDNMSIHNCIFTGNSAGGSDYYYVSYGGAISCNSSTPIISNCTIIGNRAISCGGGIFCIGNNVKVSNSLIWGNYALEGHEIGLSYGPSIPPSLTISYSDIHNGAIGAYIQSGCTLNWGPGNIDADPCFVELGYWADVNDPNIIVEPNDPNAVWLDGDYHLKSAGWRWDTKRKVWTWDDVTSRCIDAGNPGSPLGDELLSIPDDPNNEWGHNLRTNMGAFGGTAEASIPPYDWALLSDLTNDGISDLDDLDILSSLWMNTGEQLYADFNRDEIVDLFDFALLAQNWLTQTSWH
jgi:predicted outer membrane repeat protein